jgi:5-deoxy-glucuronate isomerase
MNMRTLVSAGRETAHIDLSLADLADGEVLELQAGPERAAVILSGRVDATAGETALGVAGGRLSVFEAPGDAVYAPAGLPLRLEAVGGPAQIAVTAAPAAANGASPRIIRPDDQRIAEVGKGNWSYPPHRHDRHDPPREVDLEEVYLFRVDPPGGFGVQIRYDEKGHEEAFLVRDDDIAAIRSGFHPVVAASGYSLYYLWVLAGEGREMIPYMDPAHAWVQEGA